MNDCTNKKVQKYLEILKKCKLEPDEWFTSEEVKFTAPREYKELNFSYILRYLSENTIYVQQSIKEELLTSSNFIKKYRGKYVYLLLGEESKQLKLEL